MDVLVMGAATARGTWGGWLVTGGGGRCGRRWWQWLGY